MHHFRTVLSVLLGLAAWPAGADGISKVSPLKAVSEVEESALPGLHKTGDVVLKRGAIGAAPVDLPGGMGVATSDGETVYHAPVRVAPALERAVGQGSQWPVFGGKPRGPGQTGDAIGLPHDPQPPADIDLGLVNVQVGVAPLRPAEFVIIRIPQMTTPPAQSDGPKFRVTGAEADTAGPVWRPKLLILDEPTTAPPGSTGVLMQQGRVILDKDANAGDAPVRKAAPFKLIHVNSGDISPPTEFSQHDTELLIRVPWPKPQGSIVTDADGNPTAVPAPQEAGGGVKKRGSGGSAVGFGDGLRGRVPPSGGAAAVTVSKPLLIIAEDVEGEALAVPAPTP